MTFSLLPLCVAKLMREMNIRAFSLFYAVYQLK